MRTSRYFSFFLMIALLLGLAMPVMRQPGLKKHDRIYLDGQQRRG